MDSPFNHLTLMQFCWAFLSISGFCVRVNLRGFKIFFIAIAAGLDWAVYLIFLYYTRSVLLSVFVATTLVAVYCEIVARLCKTPVSVFVTCAIIPLVPGRSLFYAMQAYISADRALASNHIADVLLIAGTISIAIAIVASITNLSMRLMNRF
ncbi:MAG: threonine/serine exporter [Candidatus Cloacimonetes bacterium]|nr:threonine/serine exporter [Candidatus Cloacimonadota bacterium]